MASKRTLHGQFFYHYVSQTVEAPTLDRVAYLFGKSSSYLSKRLTGKEHLSEDELNFAAKIVADKCHSLPRKAERIEWFKAAYKFIRDDFDLGVDQSKLMPRMARRYLWKQGSLTPKGQPIPRGHKQTAPKSSKLRHDDPSPLHSHPEAGMKKIVRHDGRSETSVHSADFYQPRLVSSWSSSSQFHYSKKTTPIVGRAAEQRTLRKFLDDEPGFRWMQLAGAGGQGKTRLAADLVENANPNWQSGFLIGSNLHDFALHAESWRPSAPHLIVIDYVLAHLETAATVFKALMERSSEFAFPVRLLVVERQPWLKVASMEQAESKELMQSFDFGRVAWFRKLEEPVRFSVETISEFTSHGELTPNGILELVPLDRDALVSVVKQVARATGKQVAHKDSTISNYLDRFGGGGRPLFAYFLAMSMAEGTFRPNWKVADLLTETLRRERQRALEGRSPEIGELTDELQRPHLIAAMATVCGGLPTTSLDFTPTRSCRVMAILSNGGTVTDERFPSTIVPPMEPDILGEWSVVSELSALSSISEVMDLCWSQSAEGTAQFLTRLAQDFPDESTTMKLISHTPPTEEATAAYTKAARTIKLNGLFQSFDNQSSPPKFDFPKEISARLRRDVLVDKAAMQQLRGRKFEFGSAGEKVDLERAFSEYMQAANSGNAKAMHDLGRFYETGKHCLQSAKISAFWYLAAAQAGLKEAYGAMGLAYENGRGLEKSKRSAIESYKKGAEKGDSFSMLRLGLIYLSGDGVSQDFSVSYEHFKAASAKKNYTAKYYQAEFHLNGWGRPPNKKEAIELFKISAEGGCIQAAAKLGIIYLTIESGEDESEKGIELLKNAAKSNNVDALLVLSEFYLREDFAARDTQRGEAYRRKAISLGSSRALLARAESLFRSNQFDRGSWYLSKAIAKGNAHAITFAHVLNVLGKVSIELDRETKYELKLSFANPDTEAHNTFWEPYIWSPLSPETILQKRTHLMKALSHLTPQCPNLLIHGIFHAESSIFRGARIIKAFATNLDQGKELIFYALDLELGIIVLGRDFMTISLIRRFYDDFCESSDILESLFVDFKFFHYVGSDVLFVSDETNLKSIGFKAFESLTPDARIPFSPQVSKADGLNYVVRFSYIYGNELTLEERIAKVEAGNDLRFATSSSIDLCKSSSFKTGVWSGALLYPED